MTRAMPPFADALGQLVSISSISSTRPQVDQGNREAIELLANWLDQLGFHTRIQILDDAGRKANLYAGAGPAEGQALIFSGHMDTVPCDPALWTGNPFVLQQTDLGFQGLGATDMKGFFALLLQSLTGIDLKSLRRPLVIIATADEESSMSGARNLLQTYLRPGSRVIIGEPTDLKPIRMHKGILMESITVKGKGGHSSDPILGINAMEVMQEVLAGLLHIRTELQRTWRHPGFAVEVPTLNLGCIHGGDNPNRICSQCEVQFDLRTLPGMLMETTRRQIDDMLDQVSHRWHCDVQRSSLFPGVEAFEQEADSTLVADLEQATGHSAGAVSFATEAPFFHAKGLDTVILGPGSIDQAHAVNEYLPGPQITPGIDLYRRLIWRYCIDS